MSSMNISLSLFRRKFVIIERVYISPTYCIWCAGQPEPQFTIVQYPSQGSMKSCYMQHSNISGLNPTFSLGSLCTMTGQLPQHPSDNSHSGDDPTVHNFPTNNTHLRQFPTICNYLIHIVALGDLPYQKVWMHFLESFLGKLSRKELSLGEFFRNHVYSRMHNWFL